MAFTLLEVLIALVVTGLVVSVAYAALQGGLDTRDRLARHRSDHESMLAMRAMIRDALRHALPGVTGGTEVFMLSDRVDAAGRPVDALEFLTRGVVTPLGTSGTWRATIRVDGDGLHFDARPDGPSPGTPVSATAGGVTGMEIRALGRGPTAQWASTWSDAGVAPQAVVLAMAGAPGVSAPLVARLNLERLP
jgi:prepilin-type N-terminal cleavage/methylation domain-containing protein